MDVFFEFCKNLFYSLIIVYGAVAVGYLSYLGFIFLALVGGQPLAAFSVVALLIAVLWTVVNYERHKAKYNKNEKQSCWNP